MTKSKFYAVLRGREGEKIYTTWSECQKNVSGWPNAHHKSFPTREAALAWLEMSGRSYVEISPSNPWSNISDSQSSHQISPAPATSPRVSLDAEPFTEDFISLSSPNSTQKTPPRPQVQLSDEQEHILELVRDGQNIFFTGSAGTGKSVLLREIIKHFGGKVSNRLAITASTGIAAVNIGGTTLHSFAGIGLGTQNVGILTKKIMSNKTSINRWQRAQALIIDEISMVDGALFDKLEEIARIVRKDDRPFGGIQLVLSGDFCQLPPVPERRDGVSVPILFAFEAKSWEQCFKVTQSTGPSVHRLTKVFRQTDQAFIEMLNSMRNGQIDGSTAAQFYKLSRPVQYSDGLDPCELFPLRDQVYEANQTRLRRIPGNSRPYEAMDVAGYDMRDNKLSIEQAKRLLDRLIAPETIELKVGAQVMLIKNLVQGHLVNGSLGQVVDFQTLNEARRCNTEIAEVDRSKEREFLGETQGGMFFEDVDESSICVDGQWPVVRFINGRTLLLTPVEFEVVNVYGTMEARRDQVPLILSWALSIHKSQGQTLERVKVDLGRTFEKGQAYVALSRATSMDGLQVLNFHPTKVMAHPRVIAWQDRVERQRSEHTACAVGSSDEFDEFAEFDTPEAIQGYWDIDL